MLGSAESEHHRLTNREIIFEEFQLPASSQSMNVTERQTDGRTDKWHAIARPRFALYSHRAVKNSFHMIQTR